MSGANRPIVHAEVGQQVSGAELIVPPAEVVGLTPRKVSSDASHISPKFGAGVLNRFEILNDASAEDTIVQVLGKSLSLWV